MNGCEGRVCKKRVSDGVVSGCTHGFTVCTSMDTHTPVSHVVCVVGCLCAWCVPLE